MRSYRGDHLDASIDVAELYEFFAAVEHMAGDGVEVAGVLGRRQGTHPHDDALRNPNTHA